MTRPFRFGVVAPLRTDLPTWRARGGRIADGGYSTQLMADVPQWQPAPGPMLALAAALANISWGRSVMAFAGVIVPMGGASAAGPKGLLVGYLLFLVVGFGVNRVVEATRRSSALSTT